MTVLGLDPGTRKCGIALVTGVHARPLHLGIVPLLDLEQRLREVLVSHPAAIAAIGQGTNAQAVARVVGDLGLQIVFVDERETTLQARGRFFEDHPPRGWRRLIPRGMLLPDRPIDDYAALLIAERFLRTTA